MTSSESREADGHSAPLESLSDLPSQRSLLALYVPTLGNSAKS
jgi:hypothetical protein